MRQEGRGSGERTAIPQEQVQSILVDSLLGGGAGAWDWEGQWGLTASGAGGSQKQGQLSGWGGDRHGEEGSFPEGGESRAPGFPPTLWAGRGLCGLTQERQTAGLLYARAPACRLTESLLG